MTSLTKAILQEIKADSSAAPVPGTEIAVQFNPQSLRLALANQVEGGDSRGRQKRQYLGKTSTTLSFDLVFDTADLDDGGEPVSVRTQTAMVERFVLPKGKGNDKQAPPKCRFSWDELVIDGIIDNLSIDFELFAANGTPLRAKMNVSIKEQDAKYELLQSGPGANSGSGATPPGQSGNGPGTSAAGPADRSASALAGESAADFAARMGLDPGAWRGIAAGIGGGASLSLSAGVSIGFSSGLSASAGIGLQAGISIGASVSVDAAFGLGGDASTGLGVNTAAGGDVSLQSGFALAAAGGLGAALQSVGIVKSETAASDARRSFGASVPPAPAPAAGAAGAPARGAASLPAAAASALQAASGLPPPGSTPKPAAPDQSRTPLKASGLPSPAQQASAAPAPPPPLADPRATSFGYGVPLRPRAGSAADQRSGAAAVAVGPRGAAESPDPTAPAWTRLPGAEAPAGRTSTRRGPPCGCGGGR